jgi:hypothetical protein
MQLLETIREMTDAFQAETKASQANQEERKAERKAFQEEMTAIMKVHHEEMTATFRADRVETKDYPKKVEANSEETESEAEHQEVFKKHAAVKPVAGLRNRAAERHRETKDVSSRKLSAATKG